MLAEHPSHWRHSFWVCDGCGTRAPVWGGMRYPTAYPQGWRFSRPACDDFSLDAWPPKAWLHWCSTTCLRAWLDETAHERGIHWSAKQKWYENRIQLGRFGVN